MGTRGTSSIGRAGLTIPLVLVLLGAGLLAVRALLPRGEPGRVVEVRVVDRRGRPVPEARVQARYAPGWHAVDAAGRVRLEDVPLRAGEEATPEAVARAIDAEAPYHAPAPGEEPAVVRVDDGTWEARVTLVPYGRVRVVVAPTRLPEVKAWIEADPLLGLAVAEGGIAVARPGQPATWRVFQGLDAVAVRVEGMTGVALSRTRVDVPNAGFVKEVEVGAEEARPIAGRVVLEDEGTVPDLAGRLAVFALDEDGEATPQPYDVAVAPDGTFTVPYAAPVAYRLEGRLDFADAAGFEARGGDEDVRLAARPRPWLSLRLPGVELATRPAVYTVRREAGGEPWEGGATRVAGDETLVALPGPGRYAVEVLLGGDATRPTLGARASVDVPRAERVEVVLEAAPVPAGEVVVTRVLDPANVRLLEPAPPRVTTYLPGFGADPVFANVPAGPVRVLVRWRDERTALCFLGGTLERDGRLVLKAEPVRGRRLRLDAAGDGVWRDARDRIVAWEAGGVGAEIRCRRLAGLPRWEGVDRIAPGTYRVQVHPRGAPGRVEAEARLVVPPASDDTPVVLAIEVP